MPAFNNYKPLEEEQGFSASDFAAAERAAQRYGALGRGQAGWASDEIARMTPGERRAYEQLSGASGGSKTGTGAYGRAGAVNERYVPGRGWVSTTNRPIGPNLSRLESGQQYTPVESRVASVRPNVTDPAQIARDRALGLTVGMSDRIMNDPQAAAALARLESGMNAGPYTQEIQQQIVNRNADQTAAAESVNADEFRNQAAARGMSASDPAYQAQLRQGQSQRQQQNIAFQGDMGTRAALTNYEAQQNAARGLLSGRMAQYGQAQPGYMQGASWMANEQFTGGRTPAVAAAPRAMAFSQPQQQSGNPFAAFSAQSVAPQQAQGRPATPATRPVFGSKPNSPHVQSGGWGAPSGAWGNEADELNLYDENATMNSNTAKKRQNKPLAFGGY